MVAVMRCLFVCLFVWFVFDGVVERFSESWRSFLILALTNTTLSTFLMVHFSQRGHNNASLSRDQHDDEKSGGGELQINGQTLRKKKGDLLCHFCKRTRASSVVAKPVMVFAFDPIRRSNTIKHQKCSAFSSSSLHACLPSVRDIVFASYFSATFVINFFLQSNHVLFFLRYFTLQPLFYLSSHSYTVNGFNAIGSIRSRSTSISMVIPPTFAGSFPH